MMWTIHPVTRVALVLAVCLSGAGCATRPSGYYEAVAAVADAERDLSIDPQLAYRPETVTIRLFFAGQGGVGSRFDLFFTAGPGQADSPPGHFHGQHGTQFVLLGFSRTEVQIGGSVFGRAITLKREGAETLTVGNVIFRKQPQPVLAPKPGEGDHLLSSDSPATVPPG